jgi:adenylosuccinate synthase
VSTLEVVVGGQFGSEAKGHITQRLTEKAQAEGHLPQVIRVAGPNAGHTGYDRQGRRWALRQVPVAAVTEGAACLGIAAGSEIDPPVLLDEIDNLRAAGLLDNKILWVSDEATLIVGEYMETEKAQIEGRVGTTAKGIGVARSERLMRRAARLADAPWLIEVLQERKVGVMPSGFSPVGIYDHTIIEGTQGFGLGLHAGYYPQCTSSDCRAQDFIAMAGVAPWAFDDVKVHVVARIYPIRIAGASGPLLNETSWEDLGLEPEFTTVTKKQRRVGMPDWPLVAEAVRANGGAPTVRLAVTMLDQAFPEAKDRMLFEEDMDADLMERIRVYLKDVQREVGVQVEWDATGPNTATNIRFMEI